MGEGPVICATPTKQLARQVLATAQREGVPGVLLIGSHKTWETADEIAVEGGEAIGIATYSAIFNSSPKLPEPRLVIFDDAHAGEQFVDEEYGITIRRHENVGAYLLVLEALSPFLSGLLLQRLRGEPDPGAHHQVRLMLPAVDPGALAKLDAALAQLPEPYKFEFAMIRSGLASCCTYLSYGGIQIRPMIPPTFENCEEACGDSRPGSCGLRSKSATWRVAQVSGGKVERICVRAVIRQLGCWGGG
ncbi:hypothetical protein EV643_103286 [Kribbella sp. VKM Ac-2527]|uniref:Uncharacterized protein n=2 Tax=Kribbella caucasensis TaxID=2512215 RepID=A0A4R6KJQ8_9ACTN|nr:hypothetical protein EV643_103286 [Kribbella sp. VKM Ac-2527]